MQIITGNLDTVHLIKLLKDWKYLQQTDNYMVFKITLTSVFIKLISLFQT